MIKIKIQPRKAEDKHCLLYANNEYVILPKHWKIALFILMKCNSLRCRKKQCMKIKSNSILERIYLQRAIIAL